MLLLSFMRLDCCTFGNRLFIIYNKEKESKPRSTYFFIYKKDVIIVIIR